MAKVSRNPMQDNPTDTNIDGMTGSLLHFHLHLGIEGEAALRGLFPVTDLQISFKQISHAWFQAFAGDTYNSVSEASEILSSTSVFGATVQIE